MRFLGTIQVAGDEASPLAPQAVGPRSMFLKGERGKFGCSQLSTRHRRQKTSIVQSC